MCVCSPASSVPCTLLQHLWNLSLSHYFYRSPVCSISLPPVYSRSLSPSSTLSFPDIDLHSSHTAEPPVALQWAHLSLLLLCVCECACRKKMLPIPICLSITAILDYVHTKPANLKMLFMCENNVCTHKRFQVVCKDLFSVVLFRPVYIKNVNHSRHVLRSRWHSLVTLLSLTWVNFKHAAPSCSLWSPVLC